MSVHREEKHRVNWASTFWPRTEDLSARGVSGEFDVDRACPSCGYNLRGLPPRARCPECGSSGGIYVPTEPIPWDDEPTVPALFRTFALAVFTPATLARHVWRPDWIEPAAAKRFRRLMLVIAAAILSAIAYKLTATVLGARAAMAAIPVDAAAVVVWLNAVTILPISLVKPAMPVRHAELRASAIVQYLSAALLLTPVHLLIYVAASEPLAAKEMVRLPLGSCPGWIFAAALHLLFLFAQLAIIGIGAGWLFFELVDIRPGFAMIAGQRVTIAGAVYAIGLLLAVPALAGLLAGHAVGRL